MPEPAENLQAVLAITGRESAAGSLKELQAADETVAPRLRRRRLIAVLLAHVFGFLLQSLHLALERFRREHGRVLDAEVEQVQEEKVHVHRLVDFLTDELRIPREAIAVKEKESIFYCIRIEQKTGKQIQYD